MKKKRTVTVTVRHGCVESVRAGSDIVVVVRDYDYSAELDDYMAEGNTSYHRDDQGQWYHKKVYKSK